MSRRPAYAVTQFLVNHDKEYERYLKPTTIVVNDINGLIDVQGSDAINAELYTIYTNNYVDLLPSCNCGNYKSKFRQGKVCPKCNTICKEEDGATPIMWIKSFDGMPFINTAYWHMVRYTVDKKVDVLRWLSDTSYNPVKKPEFLMGLLSIVGKRSYKNLIANFEKVLIYLKNITKFRRKPEILKTFDDLLFMWKTKKEDIFSNYLPIQNKKLFVMENTNKGRFINLLVSTTVDVVNGWLLFDKQNYNENKSNNLTAKTLSALTESDSNIIKDYIAGKKKLLRKQIYGHRVPSSFRCTISCIPGKHEYDVVYLPYSIGVTAYTPVILNFLVNRYNMKYLEAVRYIYKHVNLYSDLIMEILDTMAKESPYGYLMIEAHRNPTLLPGSKLRLKAKFKDNPADKTVSISKLIISIPNGDYDGDKNLSSYFFNNGKFLRVL